MLNEYVETHPNFRNTKTSIFKWRKNVIYFTPLPYKTHRKMFVKCPVNNLLKIVPIFIY